MTTGVAERRASGPIAAIRRFNRFYTGKIGLLSEGYLRSGLSLTHVRVLFELMHRKGPVATEISRDLDIDPGYLSRILRDLEKQGHLGRTTIENDGRRQLLSLTTKGQAFFAPLEERSRTEIRGMLSGLSATQVGRLVEAMRTIESLLGAPREAVAPYLLRPHRSGDMGWVVQRHGELYRQEYGWDETFEALVAGIVARFIERLDARRERCWIAERDGERVGCIFCVRRSVTVAQLRLLLVEPRARGLGIGGRLVTECVAFARAAGYRKVMLWTNDVLVAARRIYERAGFGLVTQEEHHSFGHDLVGQNWELKI